MNTIYLSLLLVNLLCLQMSCVSSAQQLKTERKPFRKSSVIIKAPTEYEHRTLANGKSYDPKPRFILIDEKKGKYELRWIGYDGKEKITPYTRQDAVDAVIAARVEKTPEGKFLYKYLVKVLPTTPNYLSGVIVQTLAQDTKPIKQEKIFIGDMSNAIQIFREGKWWHYAFMEDEGLLLDGGKEIEIKLMSSSLPGVVGCRAIAGDPTLMGAGEHMPYELESAMPGYEELASGYTIGPDERLAFLSKSDRAKYLLDNLAKFQEAGWMSEGTAKNYEVILKREDLAGALEKARKDLENEFITSEVFQIIEGLNQ